MNDRRLIEDFLPINYISAESSREKSVRKGNISTLHIWWGRRPLTACRAAVYAALVPATKGEEQRKEQAKFLSDLCRWEVSEKTLAIARQRIRNTTGGEAPKVLDMFAGGGSIPLEAQRLGCETYALELNPVAYLILLCTNVYPQKFGKKLAEEVEYWGKWVLEQVKAEIGDLYPSIPDPGWERVAEGRYRQVNMFDDGSVELRESSSPPVLTPIAYLWTRTVKCPNPACGATVPLVRQTWLCKRDNKTVALRLLSDRVNKRVRFEVVSGQSQADLGFDPSEGSKRGSASCPLCQSLVPNNYVKREGQAKRMGAQLMAVVATTRNRQGKAYLSADELPGTMPSIRTIEERIEKICAETGLTVPEEELPPYGVLGFRVQPYGLTRQHDLFTPRQLLALLTFLKYVRAAYFEMLQEGKDPDLSKAVATYLGFLVDRTADFNSSLCVLNPTGGRGVVHTFGRGALPMVWDFAESNPFNPVGANWKGGIETIVETLERIKVAIPSSVVRGSAMKLPFPDCYFDAVITDPPYYDNLPYSYLSDFFYVWLKRSVGDLYPEHFSTELTPKKNEAVAEPARHSGDYEAARKEYEDMMFQAFSQAKRVLKPGAPLVVVYAHKTTAGWATLVDALRRAGFVVTEAWPLSTERPGRLRAQKSAALASSIFLVARRREGDGVGDYLREVRPQLSAIVRDRVNTLFNEQRIAGADLVIACVGAGLRAYTQFARVELASGEELDAARYLGEVQREVLEVILEQVSGCDRRGVGGVDKPTRYYVLARFQYGGATVDFDEANVLARGVGVELDGPKALSWGRNPLVKKEKDKVALRDYLGRGRDEDLGLSKASGDGASLIDVLHRLLWLLDYQPGSIAEFLVKAQPDAGQLRLIAQSLAGPALARERAPGSAADTRSHEQHAIDRLLASWRRLVEENLLVRDTGRREEP